MSAESQQLLKQSPINIQVEKTCFKEFPANYLDINYPDEPLEGQLGSAEHNFYFVCPPPCSLGGMTAKLERIHIHAPSKKEVLYGSEHQINGNSYAFEIHFVNPLDKPTKDRTHILIGVFFREKENAQTPLSIRNLNKALKLKMEKNALGDFEKGIDFKINPSEFLPSDRTKFFQYEGSLTTPSKCTVPPDEPNEENKCWVVFLQEIEVAPEDLVYLKEEFKESPRVIQPLNGRTVFRSFP